MRLDERKSVRTNRNADYQSQMAIERKDLNNFLRIFMSIANEHHFNEPEINRIT